MQDLKGRVAVITGAASGIGRGAAEALAAEGVRVMVADIDDAGAAETVALIAARGGEAAAIHCDIAQDDALEALKAATLARFAQVDIVMNNAGGIIRGLPEHIPVEEWRRVLNVNLLSVVRSNLAFLPLFIAQGHGHIVNTASFAGLYTYAFDRLPYAAAKAAVIQISEGLALYLRPQGIGVTCLCPGPVQTGIMRSMREFGPPTDTLGPDARFGLKQPAEVGQLVVDAIRHNRFMVPTDEQVRPLLVDRATDWDGFLQERIDHPHVVMKAG